MGLDRVTVHDQNQGCLHVHAPSRPYLDNTVCVDADSGTLSFEGRNYALYRPLRLSECDLTNSLVVNVSCTLPGCYVANGVENRT